MTELPYLLHNVAKGSPSREGFVRRSGKMQVPYLVDPNTGKSVKPTVFRPDPTIGQFNVNKSVGHSSYNGGYTSIQRRMSRRIQLGVNYTYSKNRDDDSNERDYNRQYMLNVFNLKSA
jgi:hypothetical protein